MRERTARFAWSIHILLAVTAPSTSTDSSNSIGRMTAGAPYCARAQGARDRQLRQLRVQPRAVSGRARRRPDRGPQRCAHRRRGRRARARRGAVVARTWAPGDERDHLRLDRRVRLDRHPAARRVPRPPGDRARLRCDRRRRTRADARQDVGARPHRRGCVRRAGFTDHGDALPLADHRPRHDPAGTDRHRPNRRRRGDGRPPPRPRGRGCAVPPREHPHRARPPHAEELPRPHRDHHRFPKLAGDPSLADGSRLNFGKGVSGAGRRWSSWRCGGGASSGRPWSAAPWWARRSSGATSGAGWSAPAATGRR